jgi:hypothetical protein
MNAEQIAELERVRASLRAAPRRVVAPARREPVFTEGFWPICWMLVCALFKWAGILVGGLVALVVVLVLLVSWANAPRPMWRCIDVVAETVSGEVHLRCND